MDNQMNQKVKKLKSPPKGSQDGNVNVKNCVTCSNVPDGLFDANAAAQHFSKFGRVQRITLMPKKQGCMVEYEQPTSAERAVLNAGAFDGFMFDVTRTKPTMKRRSKKEDDPDWVPDSDVEKELSAMSGTPTYRITRQKPMELDQPKPLPKIVKQRPSNKKMEASIAMSQFASGVESPMTATTTQTSLSTSESAAELLQLRSRVCLTPDEQWRTLDARDRILRAWGGAGARVKVGGATIGTCPDMCPEKERLHRQSEHQVMNLEAVPDSDGLLEPWRAVKQYSRSSADQEMPMCYELRPAPVLMMTCSYLLHEVADTMRQVSLADWFHFLWDRFRGIRKDIAQQAMCCAESICLVEMCARFHAHCAARLADLEHTQFDQKLNTDNLTKCLQTLKHMYADVDSHQKPREAEFRGYIALLNLGDANFWWEIKHLPQEIQKSEPIMFAIKIFNALDNNNYVRFFRLVRKNASYLQACILLRYFNDVRARALARYVKAYAPRGGTRYPADELINSLAFENFDAMKSFINHYGLRCGKTEDSELWVILDRNQFIEDSDPYPLARELNLIEAKRQTSIGQVIAGGSLPPKTYENHTLYSSFNRDGTLKDTSFLAEDLGYNTLNDTNKDLRALKTELLGLKQGKCVNFDKQNESKITSLQSGQRCISNFKSVEDGSEKLFSFTPAIPVAPIDILNKSPENFIDKGSQNTFSFSKPQQSVTSNLWSGEQSDFKHSSGKILFGAKPKENNIFSKPINNLDLPKGSQDLFKVTSHDDLDKVAPGKENKAVFKIPNNKPSENLFMSIPSNIFSAKKTESLDTKLVNSSNKNIFVGKTDNVFKKSSGSLLNHDPKSVFGSAVKPNLFSQGNEIANTVNSSPSSLFTGKSDPVSPGTLFKSAVKPPNGSDKEAYKIFQSKNQSSQSTVAANIFSSVQTQLPGDVYTFELKKEKSQKDTEDKSKIENRQIEIKRLEETKRKQIEIQILEEKRKKEEERKQEELKKKLEEETLQAEKKRIAEEKRQIELKRKKDDEEKKFVEQVDKESLELIEELVDEVNLDTVTKLLDEEICLLNNLISYANKTCNEILTHVCNEICESEAKAEYIWSIKLMRKWSNMWRKQILRNKRRRSLLDDTPVWLTENTPIEEASILRRFVENSALKNMNAIHRGYRFTGELKLPPVSEPYNIMEIIRSSLLKRLKHINYPYEECFFWKITLVSPGSCKWLHKKIEIERWLLEIFSDGQCDKTSDSLINVGKHTWNNLMDFAISVSLASQQNLQNINEALEGTNALLFYTTETDDRLIEGLDLILKQNYKYQVVPVAIVMPLMEYESQGKTLEFFLTNLVHKNSISSFKIFIIDPRNICDSLHTSTKGALKWLARNYPPKNELEIDYLKSICQRYLGNEIWCKLKAEQETHWKLFKKDLNKMVHIYNKSVEKLTEVLTNEDMFNYPSFPLEFKVYLNSSGPYPKRHEHIPSSVKSLDNISAIRSIMAQLKLPQPQMDFQPSNAITMQDNIRTYCNQICWFNNPEEVACKVVSLLPDILSDQTLSCEQFSESFGHYDLLDLLNIIVYEKITDLNNFGNRFAVYKKSALEEYRNCDWWYVSDIVSNVKHKAIEYEDDLDYLIEAKRRKIARESLEYLMLEDKDETIVEEHIKETDNKINNYSNCKDAVEQLEEQLEIERKKSLDLENLLRAALSDV